MIHFRRERNVIFYFFYLIFPHACFYSISIGSSSRVGQHCHYLLAFVLPGARYWIYRCTANDGDREPHIIIHKQEEELSIEVSCSLCVYSINTRNIRGLTFNVEAHDRPKIKCVVSRPRYNQQNAVYASSVVHSSHHLILLRFFFTYSDRDHRRCFIINSLRTSHVVVDRHQSHSNYRVACYQHSHPSDSTQNTRQETKPKQKRTRTRVVDKE